MQVQKERKTSTTDQALQELSKLVQLFSSKELPETCAKVFIDSPQKPCSKWSLGNQLLMLFSGTTDARGYRQWQAVNRNVRKGTHAIYILAPLIIKKKSKVQNQDGVEEEKEESILIGFKGLPVFRYEDTEGAELPIYEPKTLPPLLDVAKKWGVNVKYEHNSDEYYGSFDKRKDEITLSVEDWDVFFHELGHAGQKKIDGELKGGQDPEQECIAQLTAATLSRMYGRDADNWSWNYIAHYAESRSPEAVGRLCLRVLGKVQKIIQLILGEGGELLVEVPN